MTSDNLELPYHASPARRVITAGVTVAILIGSIAYMRQLKASLQQDQPMARLPSVEAVRVPVQRAVDPQAKAVAKTAKATTLKQLRVMPRPESLDENRPLSGASRFAPLETQIWKFRARIIEARIRQDRDLYLVIEADGIRGCVEVPDPRLCEDSPFYKEIAQVRATLDKELRPSTKPVLVDRYAELSGIGFFGTARQGENGARLLPVLAVKWLDRLSVEH